MRNFLSLGALPWRYFDRNRSLSKGFCVDDPSIYLRSDHFWFFSMIGDAQTASIRKADRFASLKGFQAQIDAQWSKWAVRLVACGFTQVAGVDQNGISAPLVRMTSVNFLFASLHPAPPNLLSIRNSCSISQWKHWGTTSLGTTWCAGHSNFIHCQIYASIRCPYWNAPNAKVLHQREVFSWVQPFNGFRWASRRFKFGSKRAATTWWTL